MKATMYRWMIGVTIALILFVADTLSAQKLTYLKIQDEVRRECHGKLKDKELTPEELQTVINTHSVWLEVFRDKFETKEATIDPRRANLCGANLRQADLRWASLQWADLSGARLQDANLSEAYLEGAKLNGADLEGAKLNGARLQDANLSEAYLEGATLSGAYLYQTNLSGTYLRGANLSEAYLYKTNLSKARLYMGNFNGAHFEAQNLPEVDDIAHAENLSKMLFRVSPWAMNMLRNNLKESGYYQQEREVTYAIQRSVTDWILRKGEKEETYIASFVEAMFRFFFFDLTCQYGLRPGRALLILLILIPIFALPYAISLRLPGKNGIWRKWADDRIRLDLGTKEAKREELGWLRAPVLGLYFSVLSAFNIGWRELNVGNWIQRLQAQEYTLTATGWVRTVSGVQSLISAYLLAIWALTYFGRPFE